MPSGLTILRPDVILTKPLLEGMRDKNSITVHPDSSWKLAWQASIVLLDDRQELLPVLKGSDRCPPRVIISSKQVVRVALGSRLLQRPTDVHKGRLSEFLVANRVSGRGVL